jgi:regulator of protease activity HflC (stomatin/prohibitin superfamily)
MIGYLKASPTTYVLHYSGGRLRREGAGLSFFYLRPSSTVVAVPLASADLPFAFAEVTADFQQVTVQGRLTYRVARPHELAQILDFSITPGGAYRSDDPERLGERLVQAAQTLARDFLEHASLRSALSSADRLGEVVRQGLRAAESVDRLGVEILDVAITSIRPTPEMARALEAEAREALQRESDLAIYSRRNAAVEQERLIKEDELNTEIAVQEKQRLIRETTMAADVAIEEQRAVLIERRSANERTDADARAYALNATLEPIRELDWRTLLAMSGTGGDPRTMLAVAFRELAENAGKIGQLNVSPDLLGALLHPERK